MRSTNSLGLQRRFTPLSLLMLSVNGMVGSAWLFAPLYAAKIAGPGALIAWLIAGFGVAIIAMTFAELSVLFPVAGGTAHIPQATHGTLTSFILSFLAWIAALTMAPIEVQAVLQYASTYFTSLMSLNTHGVPVLTGVGFVWATFLMMSFCLINIISHRGLMRFNGLLFWFKTLVIVLTIGMLIKTAFHPEHFFGLKESVTTRQGWQAILSAVALGGIAFAFTGFKHGVDLAGEAKHFTLGIPLAIVGSVFICLGLYLGLQIAFLGAIPQNYLEAGWQHLSFSGDIGPFAGLLTTLGILWLVKLLYVDAVISPSGTGLIYVTSTARMLFGMSQIGYMPRFLLYLNKHGIPVAAVFFNFLIGMCLFLPLPGWQAMVNFLVSSMVISYAMGPIALLCLRRKYPEQVRQFRLPFAKSLSFLAFYFCNLLSYWTGWETISKLSLALLVGLSLFGVAVLRKKISYASIDFKSAFWIVPYFLGFILISYLGSFGGKNFIPFGWDFLVIALFSILILHMAVRSQRADSVVELVQYAI